MNEPKIGDLRVWHIPQIPGPVFYVPVTSASEASKIIGTLDTYDCFQFDNRIKPDYASMNGLEQYVEDSDGEGAPGWNEWHDDDDRDIRGEW